MLAGLGLTAAFGPAPVRAERIVNGGFETPVLAAGVKYVTLSGADIPGWTVAPGTVDLIRDDWPAFDGNQSIDLSGSPGPPGTAIFQSFASIAGESYVLSFRYANNTGVNSASGVVEILGMGGSALLSDPLTHAGSTLAAMDYLLYTRIFTADSATTTLRFTHGTSNLADFGGLVLDAVSVLPAGVVPEPTAGVLAVLGCLGWGRVGGGRRRRMG
jgi:choice-of-anchor C domain-containing protein